MADGVQVNFGADIGDALAGLHALQQAIAGVAEPVSRLKAAFEGVHQDWLERAKSQFSAGGDDFARMQRDMVAARQQAASQEARLGVLAREMGRDERLAAVNDFRAGLQAKAAAHEISLQQALAFDLQYLQQLEARQRQHLEGELRSEEQSAENRYVLLEQLLDLSARYDARTHDNQRRLAEAARRESEKVAQPFRQAFAEIGNGARLGLIGLIEGTETFGSAAMRVARSVERGFVGMLESIASKAAARPLARMLGLPLGSGDGVADVLGNAVGRWLFGMPQQAAEAAGLAANTGALAANTSALFGLATALGAGAAAGGAEAAGIGALAAAGGAAESGGSGLLGGLFGMLAFAGGGIVPSAAGGWALPHFAGAVPALLHSREMVLPSAISEGLQDMIGRGGEAAQFHAHFHGPADAPAIARWFRDNLRHNASALRDVFRANALTPRTF